MKGELIAEIMGKIYIATVIIITSAAVITKFYNCWSDYNINKKQK
jgi:hypothetical protein